MNHIPKPILATIFVLAIVALGALVFFSQKAQDALLPSLGGEVTIIGEPDGSALEEEVKPIVIEEMGDRYTIKARYNSDVPDEVALYISNTLQTFRDSVEGERFVDADYELVLTVEEFGTDSTESFLVETYSYSGGANGNNVLKAFVFKDNTQLALADVTNTSRIEQDLSTALSKEYGENWFSDGFSVESVSFYLPDEDSIVFVFSRNEILAGVYGPVRITLENPYKPDSVSVGEQKSTDSQAQEPSAESFDECIELGGLILEIFPRECVVGGETFTETLGNGLAPGDGIELQFVVGPERVECTGLVERECLVVNGNNFYDEISGFEFEAGVEQTILVERTLRFRTDDPARIPQDVGLFSFSLKEVISKRDVGTSRENKCVVAGCSSQLCISSEEAEAGGGVSTCDFREEYACYATAACEMQVSGECGWTESESLTQCLEDNTQDS